METILIIAALVLLALLGAPLFSIFGALGLIAFHAAGIDTSALIVELYRLTSAPSLMAIPLFTFAGYAMAESKTPQRLVALAQALFGWIPGGLAIVTLLTCAIFTAFTGASGVTIVALGGLLLPVLVKEKYPEGFSLGLLTTSGSLGMLFPPSLPIILYGLIAKISINQLFVAGLLPGLLLIVALALYSTRPSITKNVSRIPFTLENAWKAIRGAAWEIPLPIIVIGGLYGGLFTATEAAVITAMYVLIVEVFIYRDLKLFKDIPHVMQETMVLVGAIIVILSCAMGLTNYLVDQEIPMKMFDMVRLFVSSKITFLILLNIFLLIMGMMDNFSAIIVVVPLIVPVAMAYEVNPVHLGVIFLTNLEIGFLCPPLGLNLFISSFRFNKPMGAVVRGTLPFIGILLIALMIITYIPWLSLGLIQWLNIQ